MPNDGPMSASRTRCKNHNRKAYLDRLFGQGYGKVSRFAPRLVIGGNLHLERNIFVITISYYGRVMVNFRGRLCYK